MKPFTWHYVTWSRPRLRRRPARLMIARRIYSDVIAVHVCAETDVSGGLLCPVGSGFGGSEPSMRDGTLR